MAKNASLGDLEQAIMDVLWSSDADHGLTVREVLDGLTGRDLAYTTVMTVLSRLEAKGVTTRERDGRAWRYRPAASRESLTAEAMRSPLHDLTGAERQAAILHFLAEASPDDLAAVREAMAAVEAQGDRPARRRGRGAAHSRG
ncbi:BlaI/MecI/CopY family transcriptional regulator [Janibacter sp. YB324]|uniref:BlaI/MecI/CopY family transcriptional regulator n=1 Tax=Janibacter sp. YB324 TaxID=2761047 RepID=UPI00162A53BD|nr:BlaI/MecI/CopY family transcriptional regulator [Janibacter sp. YB324]QNF93899.1 BlaI/MecI/CopY family transcriptional regulator [Janibacter sp. YB324]